MKAFVTGASGFIGSSLARQLMARGDTVVCPVRDPGRAVNLEQTGAELVKCDVAETAVLRQAMRGADVVFHLAGMYKFGPKYIPQMRAINVDGARNVLELAAELGVPKIVHTSTIGVFGNTHGKLVDESYYVEKEELPSEYERTKWEAHYEVAVPLQARGAPVIITQPGAVTGPGDPSPHTQVMDVYLNRFPLGLGANSGVTWAHVDDIALGHILAAERGKNGESYIITGPALTWKQAMEMWQEITKIPSPTMWLPGWMVGINQRVVALAEGMGLPTPFTAEGLESMKDYTFWAKPDKAKKELGWNPRPVQETFREVLEYKTIRRGRR